MIDWAIEAWNDYGKDLKEHLRNEEVIKSIECADDDSYINLAKLVIGKILNKGLENRCFNIGISSIHIMQYASCDAMQYALSSSGDERIQALMRIALTMVQNLRRMGDK